MEQGGSLRTEPRQGRKPAWLREEKRHARKVETTEGAERRRERQLEAFRAAGLSATVGDVLRSHALRGTIR